MNVTKTEKIIDSLRQRYYKLADQKQSLLDIINEVEVAEQVYNSNAIENSTLTLEETEKILLQIDLDRFVSTREQFEASNLAKVVSYINAKAKERELDLEMVLLLHKMLMLNIRDDIAGRFRNSNEWVKVGGYVAVDPEKVVAKLKELISQYNSNTRLNIVKRIAKFHLGFENIHPFVDGNGRIGRVLNNYLLIREGYVPINIRFVDRKQYYNSFAEFDNNKGSLLMEKIVFVAITNSYHKRLAYMEGKNIVNLKEYSTKVKISLSNATNKANRQTIEAFMEKGNWKIGIEQQ